MTDSDQHPGPTDAVLEQARLDALAAYCVLDSPPEEAFDRLTRLATHIFGVSMSTITFIDGHRQWFKSRQGMASSETERAPALCNATIHEPQALVIHDTAEDERFRDNPFVTGEPNIRFYAGVPLRAPGGHAVGTLCVMDRRSRGFSGGEMQALVDLSRLVTDILDLRQQATTDPLTGVMTRRVLREQGGRAMAVAKRHRQDLSLVMVDLDHFKAINDRYGHAGGDAVLRAATTAWQRELRATDLLARIGGEEFAVLLPMAARQEARDVAERLRLATQRLNISTERGDIAVSASIGIATLDGGADGFEEFLARADTALYAAKASGRNRCEAFASAPAIAASARRRVLKAGRITFNAGHSTIDCTVRSLSDTEAGLDVVSTACIPDGFKLQIESEGLSKLCRVLTRQDKRIEIAFE